MLEQKDIPSGLLNTPPVQRAIPLDSPLEWKQALVGIRHSFFHTWEHCYAMFLTTGDPTFLYCAETPEARAVCPFVERRFGDYVDIATPYGFSGFAGNGTIPNLSESWNRFATERGYVSGFISLHPLFARTEDLPPATLYRLKTLYVMNLTRGLPTLLDDCSRSRRRELRQWERIGVVFSGRAELTSFVLSYYREFFRSRRASSVYDLNPKTLEFLLGLESVAILGVGTGARLEAVTISGLTSYAAESIFTFAIPDVKGYGVGIFWKMAEHLQRLDIPYFNLGGGLVQNDSLALFKSRFGAEQFPLHVLEEVYEPHAYSKLCCCAGVDPGDRRGYFPAYRSSSPIEAL